MSEKPPSELVVTGSATVFIEGDLVVFEIPNMGRMEFPPEVAEKLARALAEGASRLRVHGPIKGSSRVI